MTADSPQTGVNTGNFFRGPALKLDDITVVLDKLKHPDNLGSALRAMKNSGLSRIVLSDPLTFDFDRARKMATDAEDLLDHMTVEKHLRDAVAGATLVAGTTPRKPDKRPTLWLREFIEVANRETEGGGKVAIVFGNESRGLSDEDLEWCQLVVSIPAAPAKTSINLAQAVMIVGYELYQASLGPRPVEAPPPGAEARTLHALFDKMKAVLLEADYLRQDNPEHILSEFKRLIERARPSKREAELLLAAFRHLERELTVRKKP